MHVHLMGICGTAMASLAGLLKAQGHAVTGSDTQAYPPMSEMLAQLGIEIKIGYKEQNLHPRPDLVIVGNVIRKDYEEAQALLKTDIPFLSLPQAMAKFVMGETQNIVIAGTHGKTTTTALTAYLAATLGLKPGYLVGGVVKNFSKSFQLPEGDFFVIEGDEYDTAFFDKGPKFLHYLPRYVTLTSVEFDHADIYKDLDHVKESFRKLIQLVPAYGHLVVCEHDKNIKSLIAENVHQTQVYSYGIECGDFSARQLAPLPEIGTQFDLYFRDQFLSRVLIPMYGSYNVLNALSVLAHAHLLGWKVNWSEPFAGFSGIKRRQELLGSPAGVHVIEDFAHHPTAVVETLKGIQLRFPKSRLHAVFEPRSATSRSQVFQKDYENAFAAADFVYLSTPYQPQTLLSSNGTSPQGPAGLDVNQIVQAIRKSPSNGSARFAMDYSGVDLLVADLLNNAQEGDAVVIMSNGAFQGIYGKVLAGLTARLSAK